jgi:hypothetical protein
MNRKRGYVVSHDIRIHILLLSKYDYNRIVVKLL